MTDSTHPAPSGPRLTDRQQAALTAIATGHDHATAAHLMGTSARTLRRAITDAQQQLEAEGPVHAVAVAAAAGLLDLETLRAREVPPWPGPPPARRQPQPCGTSAAYQRHNRRGEEPCEACRDAHRAKFAARRARERDLPPCTECEAPGASTRRGWCEACTVRWRKAGRPDAGPPPGRRAAAVARREDFVFLLDQGIPAEEVAERVGVTVGTARVWTSKHKKGLLL